ncbi:HesB/YadR/YfhF family protein [Paenibacillus sp. IITD108]|uniref:HesB/YadR/YfhF family protein n=1 Tax=Paenibacillus sp. IITD108 TaxID=3116649 RepID=UPI002F429735
MKLIVEQQAARWYKQEMDLSEGDSLRIFVRLGGCGSVHPGLSLGIAKEEPRSPGLVANVEGIQFFLEEDNVWYVEDKDLHISFNEQYEEIIMKVV